MTEPASSPVFEISSIIEQGTGAQRTEPLQLLHLPHELIMQILSHLKPRQILTLGESCRYIHRLSMDNSLWRMLCVKKFGSCAHLRSDNFVEAYKNEKHRLRLLHQHQVSENLRNGVYISQILREHTDEVLCFVLSPDGVQLISGSKDRTIKVWDLKEGKCRQTLKGHSRGVTSLLLSADGSHLFSGSVDHTVKLWDMKSGLCLNTFIAHEGGSVNFMAFSPGDLSLVTSSDDHTIKYWDLRTVGKSAWCQKVLRIAEPITSIARSSDAAQLILGFQNDKIGFMDLAAGEYLKSLNENGEQQHQPFSLALSVDGSQLCVGLTENMIKIWDVSQGSHLHTLKGNGWGYVTALVLNGEQLISGSSDKTITIWDVKTLQCLCTLAGHDDWIRALCLSANGEQLISASLDHTIRIWDFGAGYDAVFTEIASLFRQGSDKTVNEAMDRFSRMPKNEKNRVYAKLCEILNSIKNEPDKENQDAFYERLWRSSTAEQKAQAIEKCIAPNR